MFGSMTRENLCKAMKSVTNRLVLMNALLVGACLLQWRLQVSPSGWMTPFLVIAELGVIFYALMLVWRMVEKAIPAR
jgi:hypothetical protein